MNRGCFVGDREVLLLISEHAWPFGNIFSLAGPGKFQKALLQRRFGFQMLAQP
jgi:hypothetical protein